LVSIVVTGATDTERQVQLTIAGAGAQLVVHSQLLPATIAAISKTHIHRSQDRSRPSHHSRPSRVRASHCPLPSLPLLSTILQTGLPAKQLVPFSFYWMIVSTFTSQSFQHFYWKLSTVFLV